MMHAQAGTGGIRQRRARLLGLALAFLCLSVVCAHAEPVQITVFVSPSDGGYVLGDGSYAVGETVQLLAIPYAGYAFIGWTEEDRTISTDPSHVFPADRHRVVTARFTERTGQIGVNGRWTGGITLLPGFSVDTQRFELGFDQPPGASAWTTRMTATFSGDGDWTDLQFSGSGGLGDLRTSTGLTFDPLGSGYRSAFLAVQWTGEGMTVGFRASHAAMGGSPPGPYLLYTWTLRTGDLSLTARLEEPCGEGLALRDLQAQITGIELCCGVTLRGVMSFAACGFECIGLYANGIAVTDGLSVDLALRYCLDGKEVSLTPRWDPICLPCIVLYGDLEKGGVDLYGFKIRCCLSDFADPDCPECASVQCPPGSRVRSPYLEYVLASEPSKVPVGFQGDESSYVKVGFCDEGCCGGAFDLELTAFFAPIGSLFGLTRIVGYLALPWSEALRWQIDAEFNFVGGDTTFKLGWDYRF
jgi:hypothetical protein